MRLLAKEISSCYIRHLLAAPQHACIFSGDVQKKESTVHEHSVGNFVFQAPGFSRVC